MSTYSEKREHSVILAVTIGSILEWYEIYLFIYWAPTIARLFFAPGSESVNLTNTFLLFALGFLARPFGGVFFGRIGDRIGRKKALILSIIIMIFPTVCMGLLPTYHQIGIAAPIIIMILRLAQSLPAGGELPGAFCYLYESTHPSHRRYMTSWGAVGNQIGIIISMLECYLLERFLSPAELMAWGWRFSFLIGGLIGVFGLCLRTRLHETPLYKDIEKHHQITKQSIYKVIIKHKRPISLGIMFCILNSVGFYLMSVLFPVYFKDVLGTTYDKNLIISVLLLILTTIPLPFLGMMGDKFSNKKMLIISTIGIILLLYPLYLSLSQHSLVFSGILGVAFILFFTCLSALIPYRFANLFSTPIRFTCVGISYNIVDGIIGGFSPAIVLYLINRTGSQTYFYLSLLATALISLFAFFMIQENKQHIA